MDILKAAQEVQDYVVECRRHLHRYPEVSDKEYKTIAYIMEQLEKLGVEHYEIENGGILAFIEGSKPGKTILLRADVDALPMQEDSHNDKYPKVVVSENPGVAHSCGHDSHTAMLLGATKILNDNRELIEGKVIICFERGEEGTGNIYYIMKHIQENNIHIDGCWGQHGHANLPVGTMGLLPGGIYAGVVGWDVIIKGKGGHGSRPWQAVNPIDCAAAIVTNLNTLRMRKVSPYERVTFTTCKLYAGTKGNIIPDYCELGGTCRFYDADLAGSPMKEAIRIVVESTAEAYGCVATFTTLSGPSRGILNDPTCYKISLEAIGAIIGNDKTVEFEPKMGGESFSTFAAYYPSMFGCLGVQDEEKGFTAQLHNPKFEANEESFPVGVASTVAYALAFLRYKEPIPFTPFEGDIDAYMEASGSKRK